MVGLWLTVLGELSWEVVRLLQKKNLHILACIIYFGMHRIFWHASHILACIAYFGMHHIFWHASHILACISYFGMHLIFWHASHILACISYFGMYHRFWHASQIFFIIFRSSYLPRWPKINSKYQGFWTNPKKY
jgi:hypothetical protein